MNPQYIIDAVIAQRNEAQNRLAEAQAMCRAKDEAIASKEREIAELKKKPARKAK